MNTVTLIRGDGIGYEISEAVKNIIDASGAKITWEVMDAGQDVYKEKGVLVEDKVFESIEKNKIAIKGPITTPIGSGFRSINVMLRKKYDLYANIRPVVSIPAVQSKYDNIDLIIFRENTEDLYAGIEKQIDDDTAQSIKIITRKASTRIIKKAFEYAKDNNKDKVTVVTKANIMKLTDGMFLDIARQIAKSYPEITLEEMIVDNACMQLVMHPENFQVIVTENLYGDILSDLCAGLIGGLGIVPGANVGENMAIFEAVHGSAPDIAGKNTANPTAMLLSGCMMLEYMGEKTASEKIKKALFKTIEQGCKTKDLQGNASTTEFANQIIKNM